ncbi:MULTISPECIES: T9SS type B sorting domain-containing protein [Flavobacterium]|uniref:T9SS type B sorting domain-containing protein n=1 Tax=Flavobacterium TaxID=237 RepID=UPI001FCA8422|nr:MULTISPECIES: T9SS type B sorting domain-containing protein [Flavobacterium]UOK42304.1 T9SS type B sorting domain-containing protein [Flavobacterium enshiense]
MKKILVLFLVFIFGNVVFGQVEPNDCVNAIPVCGNGSFITNTDGSGNAFEVAGCGPGREHNSLWLKITIAQAGTLGFDLIPNNPDLLTGDYDFFVYGPNRTCGTGLGTPIRCNATNPDEANLPNNITGMNGSTPSNFAWSGSGGNNLAYVQWLTVLVGETYYIAIDRPYSTDTGFTLNWIGSATLGTGAFPKSPTLVQTPVPDMATCSTTGTGVFQLNTHIPKICTEANTAVRFYPSYVNAVDDVNNDSFYPGGLQLPVFYGNVTNPEVVYAKVYNTITKCYIITTFNLVVYPVPQATMSVSPSQICAGENVTVAFTGTPGATVDYTIGGGPIQSGLLDAAGNYQFTDTPSNTLVYTLVGVKTLDSNNALICNGTVNNPSSTTLTVNPLPTITGGSLGICVGGTTQFIGSPTAAAIDPWISSNTNVATVDSAGNVLGVNPGTSDITYTNSNGCSDKVTITVNALPTISGTLATCIGATTTLSATNPPLSPNAWSTSNSTVATITPAGVVTGVNVGTATITYTDINGCTDTEVVNVLSSPTASIAIVGPSTICSGSTAIIEISGSAGATVNYTVNGTAASVVLPATGIANFPTAALSVQTTYQLVSVSAGTGCTTPLTQQAVVNIAPQPTASISGSTSVCFNQSATISFSGTPGATVGYTINGGTTQTVLLNASGSATVSTGSLTADTTYALVNVTAGTVPNCVETVSGTATVTVVQTPTVAANPTSQSLCSGQSSGIQLTGTVPNTTFSWTVTQTGGASGATNGSGSIISQVLTTGNTVGTVTYTITPAVGSCVGTPIDVTVTISPVPVVFVNVTQQTICSGNPTNITMTSSIPTATFSWNVTQTSGVTGASAGTGSSINQTLTAAGTQIGQVIYTIIATNAGCQSTTETVTVTVYPYPTALPSPNSDTLCSGETTNIELNSNIPGTTFDWTVAPVGVSGAASGSGNIISQTLTTISLSQGTVVYTITPTVNGCTGTPVTVTVTVNPTPEVFGIGAPQEICSGDPSGIIVTPNISGTSISWTVVQNGVTGASDGSGTETTPGAGIPIDQTLTASGDTPGTVTYNVTPIYNGCSGQTVPVVIVVNPTPKINIPPGFVCTDNVTGALISGYIMDTGLSAASYSFQWFYNNDMNTVIATSSSYEATQAGVYTVSIMNSSTGCDAVFDINVEESNPAQSASAVVTNYFADTQAITVTVVGNGTYLYSLDGGAFQTSNVFINVLPGTHTVTIHDTHGCTDIVLSDILTIGYPRYFTPNGDGYNDTWNIWSLSDDQPNSEIHIYDRYGKLLKQIVPSGAGWDGTFNGQTLPSTDYWFTVKYKENGADKLFKAHFSMKR